LLSALDPRVSISRGPIDPIIEVQLGSEMRAVSAARQALDALADTLGIYDLNTTKLLAAELVQHALAHGGGAITLRAAVTAQLVRVEVVDQSEGPTPDCNQRVSPIPRALDFASYMHFPVAGKRRRGRGTPGLSWSAGRLRSRPDHEARREDGYRQYPLALGTGPGAAAVGRSA